MQTWLAMAMAMAMPCGAGDNQAHYSTSSGKDTCPSLDAIVRPLAGSTRLRPVSTGGGEHCAGRYCRYSTVQRWWPQPMLIAAHHTNCWTRIPPIPGGPPKHTFWWIQQPPIAELGAVAELTGSNLIQAGQQRPSVGTPQSFLILWGLERVA
jgi:hypothetical protein